MNKISAGWRPQLRISMTLTTRARLAALGHMSVEDSYRKQKRSLTTWVDIPANARGLQRIVIGDVR